jgi:signal transduction histidine kinase
VRATHSPSAEGVADEPEDGSRLGTGASGPGGDRPRPTGSRGSRFVPHSFQARLTLGFVAVVALTLALVAGLAINRLGDYFSAQEQQNLAARSTAVANILGPLLIRQANPRPVVGPDNTLNPQVATYLSDEDLMQTLADRIAQADLLVRIGTTTKDSAGTTTLVQSPGAAYAARLVAPPLPGQTRQAISRTALYSYDSSLQPWAMEVSLANPYTYQATTIADLTLVVALVALVALVVAVAVAALLARRFTAPLRRLTEASRVIAEGDLSARVPAELEGGGTTEVVALSRQFNHMAARLEESVEIIRRDRDRSRDFLADVSHELRTPIAALRMFNELMREGAVEDPAARDEFLESSAQQLERLDWLAQNLLELSKLDSGLILLDLRPDDLRTAVESAVEQAEVSAQRRGVSLALTMPPRPLRIRHDPQRIGQVVGNLVGNALKFTPRGGSVAVQLEPYRDGALIRVTDTGVGIDAAELPRIFDRFYRGSRANEARSSGSGLGLAIVRSIVDMHEGRISVESRVGRGSTFTVYLPHDPRAGEVVEPPDATSAEMVNPLPGDAPPLNPTASE